MLERRRREAGSLLRFITEDLLLFVYGRLVGLGGVSRTVR